jgi:ubiquinone/menaquinone biosynthesis C-methylase UbiE
MKSLSHLDPPMKPVERVLELGMGVGAFLKVVKDEFQSDIWGSDICPKPIEIARQVFPNTNSTQMQVADAKDWDEAIMTEEKFDHVFSNYVMTYMRSEKDAIQMLRNALRATKIGGSLLFGFNVAPDSSNVGYSKRKYSVVHFWTKLQAVLKFKITSIQYGATIHQSQGDRYFIYLQKLEKTPNAQ